MGNPIEMIHEPKPEAASHAPLRMSYEEFLNWEHTGIAEWENGEVFQTSVKREHQDVINFLNALIWLFVKRMELGFVNTAPFVMKSKPEGPGREPDLMFVSHKNATRYTSDQLIGPADLLVEVISEESVARDRVTKFEEYEDIGVREYWLIDSRPERLRADFYVLDDKGRYRPVPIADDNTYHSTVLPGFWINIDWLWEQDADVLSALTQIVGVEQVIRALKK
jgi:Uma2 family endonuclease